MYSIIHRKAHRRAAAGLAALTVLASVTTCVVEVSSSGAGAAASGATATFSYTPPSPLPTGNPGTVIEYSPSTYTGGQSGVTSTRIMYLSSGVTSTPSPVTGDVLVPNTPWTSGPRPIVAYAPFTYGGGMQCTPSMVFSGAGSSDFVFSVQTGFVNALLSKGFGVVVIDYPRTNGTGDEEYAQRLPQAHAVLDGLRAAQQLPGTGLPSNGPVGIVGYSQGGGASAAAAELAPTYAPELNLVGAYVGSPPADLSVVAKSLDGGLYVSFVGFAINGLQAAYPQAKAAISNLVNANGAQLLASVDQKCTLDAVFSTFFTQTSTLTKNGQPVASFLTQEPFASILADDVIGNIKPKVPTLVQMNIFDDAVPSAQAQAMAHSWCSKGATVQWNGEFGSPFFGHFLTALSEGGPAADWIAARFAGTPATSNCGTF